MGYILNTTDDYHIHALNSLGWELTVCNALYPPQSPCRGVLQRNASFGVQLFHFLERLIPLHDLKTILEVGGGLGYLMKDFLTLAPRLQATLLDISPFLLNKQKDALTGFPAHFLEMDFLKMAPSDLRKFDLVILNENLGDFPTLVSGEGHSLQDERSADRFAQRIEYFKNRYSLPFTLNENINIGALDVVEKLCAAGVPYIYLSEHSCESSHNDPIFPLLNFSAPGTPERISLQGHAEFTIKFSHLERIAETFRYEVIRGQYTDILPIDFNDKVKTALRAQTPSSDGQEIIQQFVYDLYKYEYLVLIHIANKKG